MNEYDFLSLHGQKAAEYLLGVAYLLLFIPLWKFISTPVAEAQSHAVSSAKSLFDWFRIPDGFFLHPGHAWAKAEGPGSVAVGLDDFGHRLIGPVSAVLTPLVGEPIRRGEPAFSIVAEGKRFDLLAPIDGVVAEVNRRATIAPDGLHADPYGSGWVLKGVPRKLSENLGDLLSGDAAMRFLQSAAERLMPRLQAGMVTAQDGGAPVHGIAREIDPDHWDDLVRSQFLTK
ncbi:MAG TPA: glycine cleavage system protein H [Thermoanaerobaculia bacterium]